MDDSKNNQDAVQDEHSDKPVLKASPAGVTVPRRFSKEGIDPMSEAAGVEWELRNASISGANGEMIFEQKDIETPKTWSQTATNIVVNKYFRGAIDTPERETSIRQLVSRVSDTLTTWGRRRRYFASEEDALAFRAELTHLLVSQKAAFNSPVWFNVGVEERPQCSACFINSVDDTMESILGLAKTEGMLFKYGSGAGSNLSTIRGSKENLAGGGTASGPVSFMKGFDSFAGVIKSGGKTRRAAKMVILDVEHPDIEQFVTCKRDEEEKAWALIEAGYDGGFNVPGGAYDSVYFQNANHSVRVTDDFMKAVENGSTYDTLARRDGSVVETKEATKVWRQMAEAAWICGDPGIQFDTVINDWHTCKNTDRIYASNPCSEYMFLNDSACNLSSLNLMKFRNEDGSFDTDGFRHAVNILILGQEIIVDDSSYPTELIQKNSHAYRPLGLGYANLGAFLMAAGIPYDSDEGRKVAGVITALLGGEAYSASAEIAKAKGAFAGYSTNRDAFLGVIEKHKNASYDIDSTSVPDAYQDVLDAARLSWDMAAVSGKKNGFRNAQVTVLAPTGTIGFMMDCDTTGIEPDIALIKYKKLVGGGLMKIVNNTVPMALSVLGYTDAQVKDIIAYLNDKETIEGAPHLKDADLAVFDCAFKPMNGVRTIEPMGHVLMMGAAQPFLSGAISKTVNMPHESTVEEIADIYMQSWKAGLKAVAIYRDGCKRSQPLSTSNDTKAEIIGDDVATGPALPVEGYKALSLEEVVEAAQKINDPVLLGRKLGYVTRRRLPDERAAITHKFSIAGHEGYITVGLFEDGQPGELFCTMSKEGSTISGLMDCFATAISLSLQYGVPLKVLVDKFQHTRFEPSGFTGNKHVPIAKSVADYVFRWLGMKFLPEDERPFDPSAKQSEMFSDADVKKAPNAEIAKDSLIAEAQKLVLGPASTKVESPAEKQVFSTQSDAPPCQTCGSIMVRNGACYKCLNCGSTSGCS
ncbi:MAG: vitamin B12-dependent ribonucleotide reductase [Deltaproteobacteria bacterium]|nr:vitamin B12-dependent ribonucleotide reductase [Deltaproteobacteria bacterium]